MAAITLDATVDENHNLTLRVPDNMPTGRVEVTVRSLDQQPAEQQPLTRETARAKLLAAGRLSTFWKAPEGFVRPTDAELIELSKQIPPARPAEELISEDRGEY